MKKYILGILLISFMFFGCLGPSCETECPEGFIQQDDCTCVPMDITISLKQGENTTLDDWEITVRSITENIKYSNGICEVSNQKVRLNLEKGDETRSITLENEGTEKLTNSILFIEDINQIYSIEKKGCEVNNKKLLLNVISSDLLTRTTSVKEKENFEIFGGTEIKVDSIGMTADFMGAFSDTYKYDEGETRDIRDIEIEIVSITQSTSLGDIAEITIEKEENTQASLTGDYTIKIREASQDIGTPDTEVLTETYGVGDQVTMDERTKISINAINFETKNCTEGCDVELKEVTLRVNPEGSRTAKTFTLKQGNAVFVSNRIRVQATNIDANIECVSEVCQVSNKNVTLRITTYNKECIITNRQVDLELLFPDLTSSRFTLGFGDEKAFITGERVKVDSIRESMEDSVNGTCEIENERVTLTLTLPVDECTATNHKVELKITEEGKTNRITLNEGQNTTTGINNGIFVSADKFDITLRYNEARNRCEVVDERVTLTIESNAKCTAEKENAVLEYGDRKSTLNLGNSIFIDDIEVKLDDLTADVTLDGRTCRITNKQATFKIMEPLTEDISLKEEDTENFGDLKLTLEALNFETKEENEKCAIIGKEAEFLFGMDGTETSKKVNEGEVFEIGNYKITILEILGEPSDKALYSCVITDRDVKLKLLPFEED